MIRMAMRTAVIISSKEGFESIFHALPRNATATHNHDPFPMGNKTMGNKWLLNFGKELYVSDQILAQAAEK